MSFKLGVSKSVFYASFIGNLFEHYDSALFALLAPFIAPLFFPESSPISALLLTYGMMILGIISKPIGALVFGIIGDRFGRKHALSLTLVGMATITFVMGCLPTYQVIGPLAPILLAACRFFQSFFAAGEVTGGAILVLEQTQKEEDKSYLSSLYGCSTILGIFLASGIVTVFSFQKEMMTHLWRIPFFLGGVCGVCGMIVRLQISDSVVKKKAFSFKAHALGIWEYRTVLIPIALASGFSYTIYTHSFTFINGFLPLISSVSKQDACALNTVLLLFDLLLLPLFGWVAKKWGKERLMITSSALTFIAALPLFGLLTGASLFTVVAVRMLLITLGVAFSAPFHHWSQEKIPQHLRYTLVATSSVIGSQLIGIPSAAVSLWLYQKTGLVISPGIYLMTAAFFAMLSIKQVKEAIPSVERV